MGVYNIQLRIKSRCVQMFQIDYECLFHPEREVKLASFIARQASLVLHILLLQVECFQIVKPNLLCTPFYHEVYIGWF